jgi:hypothetical protein
MGGTEGQRFVLRGRDVDGSSLRWSFNNIQENSFRWLGETSSDGGVSWRTEQEMHLHRQGVADGESVQSQYRRS